MAKKKRVNPHRIPISMKNVDKAAIINDASYANLYFGWLLVLHAMLEQEAKTPEEIGKLWDAADRACVEEGLKQREIRKAEEIMGLREPYPNLNTYRIKSEVELRTFRERARKNAIFLALCSICLGLDGGGLLDREQLRHIFANVALTLAEIEGGCTTYQELAEKIAQYGLTVVETESEIILSATDEKKAGGFFAKS